MALGETWLPQPITGWWTLPDYPDVVNAAGRRFRRARWKQDYDGVVEQYREEVAQNSMHLKVYEDGRWVIDHVDEDNPDMGREVPHFFNDHPLGQFLKAAGAVVGVVACVAVAGAAIGAVVKGIADG